MAKSKRNGKPNSGAGGRGGKGTAVDVSLHRIDRVAERHGFVGREPALPYRRPPPEAMQTVTIHTGPPVPVAAPFQKFCDDNQLPYWQGIKELMKRAGVT